MASECAETNDPEALLEDVISFLENYKIVSIVKEAKQHVLPLVKRNTGELTIAARNSILNIKMNAGCSTQNIEKKFPEKKKQQDGGGKNQKKKGGKNKQKIKSVAFDLSSIKWSGGPNDKKVYEVKGDSIEFHKIQTDLAGKETEMTDKVQAEAKRLGLKSSRLKRAPSCYYDESLEWRRDFLGAPSCKYLCKTLLYKNSKCTQNDCSNPFNSKYYFVIRQYAANNFDNEKSIRFMRAINDGKISKKKFNFRAVPEELCCEMTGFEHNGVTVIGSNAPEIPIILDQRILDLGFIWLGGGEADVKWAINIAEFRNVFKPFVTDCTYNGWQENVDLKRVKS